MCRPGINRRLLDSTSATACRLTAAHSSAVLGSRLNVPFAFEIVPTESQTPWAFGATTDCMSSRMVLVGRYRDSAADGGGGVRQPIHRTVTPTSGITETKPRRMTPLGTKRIVRGQPSHVFPIGHPERRIHPSS